MRFMFSRRWALFAITVVLLVYVAYLLGQWQFHRLDERKATNAQTRINLRTDPVSVSDALRVGRESTPQQEWLRVRATGTYDAADSVVIRYQTRDGDSGVDIVTPLRTDAGPSLLVDRGWMQTGNVGADTVDAPAPPAGQVTVVGYVRADATGDAATVTDRSARAISSREIARTMSGPVYGGFIDAASETPRAAKPLAPAELPDLGNGPHFFYGLQWYFFGLLAGFGFFYLAYDEGKKLRAAQAANPPSPPVPQVSQGSQGSQVSQGPEHAPVDRDHRAGDEARRG